MVRVFLVSLALAASTPPAHEQGPMNHFRDPFNRPIPPNDPPAPPPPPTAHHAPAARSPQTATNAAPPPESPPPPRCHDGMAEIQGGTYNRRLIPIFCLDKHEVTVAEFAAYLAKLESEAQKPGTTKHTRSKTSLRALRSALTTVSRVRDGVEKLTKPGLSEHCTWADRDRFGAYPINCISAVEAEAYCRALGKRLPTELEWHWAARDGKKQSKYPGGMTRPTTKSCHIANGPKDKYNRPQTVQQFEPTVLGLYDMAGNVWEWTQCDADATACTLRGGSFRTHDERHLRLSYKNHDSAPLDRSDEVGFRCASARTRATPTP